jgi:syntaxin-binding protein 5
VTSMSMASNTGEFAVGTSGGEVIIYRWDGNRFYGRNQEQHLDPNPGGITDISSRSEPSLKQGLQPNSLYEMMQGPISVVKVSDVGFIAVGSENGFFSIIDMRGPSIIFQASMAEFVKQEKRSSFSRGRSAASGEKEWPVVIQFGVMTLEGDKFSSICCFVGTNLGKVITFTLLPAGSSYSAKLAGVSHSNGKVIAICPIVADTGKPAYATGQTVAGLREGTQVNGLLVVGKSTGLSRSSRRIY